MRLDKFDLNLLVALDALLEERSVTRTAERLGLTQSGVSAALARLRDAFGDPLLVQHGKKMLPTQHAEALHPRIRHAIADLRALIASTSTFDPATSTRRFRIAASDYMTTMLLAPLMAAFSRAAPEVGIEVILPHASVTTDLAHGNLDLLLSPAMYLDHEHPSEVLFVEDYLLGGCSANPILRQAVEMEAFRTSSHIAVAVTGKPTHFESFLREQNIERRIDILVPSFLQAPFLLPGTKHVCVMHARLARTIAKTLPISLVPLPFAVPSMQQCMQYHGARQGDPGLAWLRSEIRSVAAHL